MATPRPVVLVNRPVPIVGEVGRAERYEKGFGGVMKSIRRAKQILRAGWENENADAADRHVCAYELARIL